MIHRPFLRSVIQVVGDFRIGDFDLQSIRAPSRPPHFWRGADDATLCYRCASCHLLSPENTIYLAGTGCAGPYLYGSNAVSCCSVGGVLTQEETVLTDFHLQWKIEYKSGFIGNNYKKVVYLGKEVCDTPACSLV